MGELSTGDDGWADDCRCCPDGGGNGERPWGIEDPDAAAEAYLSSFVDRVGGGAGFIPLNALVALVDAVGMLLLALGKVVLRVKSFYEVAEKWKQSQLTMEPMEDD